MANVDPHVNPATGVWDDNYYANTGRYQPGGEAYNGDSGGGGADPVLAYIQGVANDTNAKMQKYNDKLSAYDKANPFSMDDALKKEQANVSQRISPYYAQTLNDFMHGVDITRQRSMEDENRMVTETLADKDAYTGQAKADLDTALLNTGQHFSDAGSYDSGARARTQGVQEADTGNDITNYTRQANYNINTQQIAGARLRNVDLPYQTGIEKRNLGAEQSYETQAQAYPQAQNDYNQWQYNRQQASGPPPGVDPATWQNSMTGLLSGVSSNIGNISPTG